MTTVVAVKKGKRIAIAADTLTVFGLRKECLGHLSKSDKVISIGTNYIGIAGEASWDLVLKQVLMQRGDQLRWESADQIFAIFNDLHQELKKMFFLLPPDLLDLSVESSEFELLIANPYGIFEVEYSRAVRKHISFAAIGSGASYALGAMQAIYDQTSSAEEIAKSAIHSAAAFDAQTELPLQLYSLDT